MNYQYIEQLIQRYFDCQTTLQEEQILRSFFQQEDVPSHLSQYAGIFTYESETQTHTLGDDFDARMLAMIADSDEAAKPKSERRSKVVTMGHIFAPFFKAVAMVAVVLTIGNAADHAIGVQHAESAAEEAGALAIDPYIKTSDIQRTLRMEDANVNKAELKLSADTILYQQMEVATDNGVQ